MSSDVEYKYHVIVDDLSWKSFWIEPNDPQIFGPNNYTQIIIIPRSIDIDLVHTPGSRLYSDSYLTDLIESFDKPVEDRKSFLVRMFNKIFR